MSLTKLFFHCNWSTKLRQPLLTKNLRVILFEHIIYTSEIHSIEILEINGWIDHVHTLLRLHPSQNLANTIHQLKGESSSWINRNALTEIKFLWQDGYYAETINFKELKRIRDYIKNQDMHHRKINYIEELKNAYWL